MISILLFFGLVAIVVFGKLPFTFFQQDEWAIFGNYLYWQKADLSWFTRLFVYEQDTHLIPLGNFVSFLQFYFFGLSFIPYGIASILLHLANSILVYKLAKSLALNIGISILAGLLFLVNSVARQAITWTATTVGTAGSTFFVLLSLLWFLRYLREYRLRHLIGSLTLFLFSLGFKETSIFLFFFYPVFWLIYAKNKKGKSFLKFFLVVALVGVGYILTRSLVSTFWVTTAATAAELSQPSLLVYLFRIFTNPLKVIAQSVLPVPIILTIARHIVGLGYPQFMQGGTPDPYLVESVASDMVSYAVSFLVLFIALKSGLSKILLLAITFLFTSSIPLTVIPGKAGFTSLLDGRHLYLPSIFVAIALSAVFSFRKFLFVAGLMIVLSYHGLKIRKDIDFQVAVAEERRSILSTILSEHPKLPTKTVFYIESDTAFYGLAPGDNIVPFQSGFGQTLLVWYNQHGENFPACFFEKKFLYVLTSQEYKECGGRGFGYYRKFHDLATSVRVNHLKAENIIAFSYSASEHKVKDITELVHQRL